MKKDKQTKTEEKKKAKKDKKSLFARLSEFKDKKQNKPQIVTIPRFNADAAQGLTTAQVKERIEQYFQKHPEEVRLASENEARAYK